MTATTNAVDDTAPSVKSIPRVILRHLAILGFLAGIFPGIAGFAIVFDQASVGLGAEGTSAGLLGWAGALPQWILVIPFILLLASGPAAALMAMWTWKREQDEVDPWVPLTIYGTVTLAIYPLYHSAVLSLFTPARLGVRTGSLVWGSSPGHPAAPGLWVWLLVAVAIPLGVLASRKLRQDTLRFTWGTNLKVMMVMTILWFDHLLLFAGGAPESVIEAVGLGAFGLIIGTLLTLVAGWPVVLSAGFLLALPLALIGRRRAPSGYEDSPPAVDSRPGAASRTRSTCEPAETLFKPVER